MPQSLLGFGFRSHSDVAQARARHLREEALDQVEPGAVLWREDEAKAALSPSDEPLFGLLGHMRRLIVQDDFDRDIERTGRVELLEKSDEFGSVLAVFDVDTNVFDILRSWFD
jgi:hypothetical protein